MTAKSVQGYLPPMEVPSVSASATRRPVQGCPEALAATAVVERALVLLRRCVADCDYSYEALGAALGKSRGQVHRVLHGERPLTLLFLASLPADVKAMFAQRSAEALGLIVVKPLEGNEAVRGLVGGLVGLLMKGAA